MKTLLKLLSFIGLVLTGLPSILFFMEKIELETSHHLMTVGMIIWFVTAPFWINAKVDKA
ncbi:MAG: hypothetical protein PSV36_04080 [Algoriphagus sp.]|nr:hypothetical protein [Algoriphagus sp.]